MKLSKKLSPAVVENSKAEAAPKAKKKTAKLSTAEINKAKPEPEPYRIWDTEVPQLHLRVQPSGIKSFNVQWSRTRSKSLGKWPGVTVEAARTRARALLVETHEQGAPASVIEAAKPDNEKPITLGDFIKTHYAPWALAHQKAGQATLDALASTWGDLYDKLLAELVALDVERIKSKRLKAGKSPATANRDLDRIRGVFSKAVEWNFLPAHPLKSVKRAKGADDSRVRYLTDTEEKSLRAAITAREAERRKHRESGNSWCTERGGDGRPLWPADGFTDHLAPIVLLALNTGMRRGELLGLNWRSVNMAARTLTVEAGNAKSRKARHIPLNDEALDVLTRWRRQASSEGLAFPGNGGGRMSHINTSWEGIVEEAGLQDFRFHDLRHSFASRLVMAGVDLNTVRELLGHSDLKMTLRYAHLAPRKLADAVALLGNRR